MRGLESLSETELYSDLLEASDSILGYTQETGYFTGEEFKEEIKEYNQLDEDGAEEIIRLLEDRDIMNSIDSYSDDETDVYSGVRFRTGRFEEVIKIWKRTTGLKLIE